MNLNDFLAIDGAFEEPLMSELVKLICEFPGESLPSMDDLFKFQVLFKNAAIKSLIIQKNRQTVTQSGGFGQVKDLAPLAAKPYLDAQKYEARCKIIDARPPKTRGRKRKYNLSSLLSDDEIQSLPLNDLAQLPEGDEPQGILEKLRKKARDRFSEGNDILTSWNEKPGNQQYHQHQLRNKPLMLQPDDATRIMAFKKEDSGDGKMFAIVAMTATKDRQNSLRAIYVSNEEIANRYFDKDYYSLADGHVFMDWRRYQDQVDKLPDKFDPQKVAFPRKLGLLLCLHVKHSSWDRATKEQCADVILNRVGNIALPVENDARTWIKEALTKLSFWQDGVTQRKQSGFNLNANFLAEAFDQLFGMTSSPEYNLKILFTNERKATVKNLPRKQNYQTLTIGQLDTILQTTIVDLQAYHFILLQCLTALRNTEVARLSKFYIGNGAIGSDLNIREPRMSSAGRMEHLIRKTKKKVDFGSLNNASTCALTRFILRNKEHSDSDLPRYFAKTSALREALANDGDGRGGEHQRSLRTASATWHYRASRISTAYIYESRPLRALQDHELAARMGHANTHQVTSTYAKSDPADKVHDDYLYYFVWDVNRGVGNRQNWPRRRPVQVRFADDTSFTLWSQFNAFELMLVERYLKDMATLYKDLPDELEAIKRGLVAEALSDTAESLEQINLKPSSVA